VPRAWPKGRVSRSRCPEPDRQEPEHVPRQSATPDAMVCSQHGAREWRRDSSADPLGRLTNRTFRPGPSCRSQAFGGRNHCELVMGSPGSEGDEADLRRWLDADEHVIATLIGDGASLLATPRRIVLVREGSEFRPRTGLRSWTYDRIVRVSLVQPRHGQARILVVTADNPRQPVSMFFEMRRWRDAERLAAEIRSRVAPSA